MNKPIISILFLLFLSGCSMFSVNKENVFTSNTQKKSLEFERDLWPVGEKELTRAFVKNGKVINVPKLKHGGKVLVLAFRAGKNVRVDPDLDRTALLILRGITEIIDSSDPFNVVFSEEEGISDFVIDGHIIEYIKKSNRRFSILKANEKVSVKGKMIFRETSEIVAIFEEELSGDGNLKSTDYIAEKVGQNIGLLILSALN